MADWECRFTSRWLLGQPLTEELSNCQSIPKAGPRQGTLCGAVLVLHRSLQFGNRVRPSELDVPAA